MPVGCIALASSESVKSITPAIAPGLDQPLHGRAADPVGVEDNGLVAARLERRQHPHHGRRGVAEHRDPHAALAQVLRRAARVARHAHHGGGGVVEHGARDRVEPEDVGDRVHHERVALAHEGPERPPARGARRDDQLGHPHRQRGHRRRAEQRALGAAEAERAVQRGARPRAARAPRARPPASARPPRRASPAARTSSSSRPAARATSARGTSASQPRALAEDAGVDHDRLTAERADAVAHVRGLVALGVERGYQRDPRGRGSNGAASTDRAARPCRSTSIESWTYWS